MKLMSNFLSATILATSLATFNVPMAIASEVNPQDVIKTTFADFTLNLHQSKVENSQVILRQELSKAAQAFANAGVSQKDLINYAVSDMNPVEALAFRNMADSLADADLRTSEGQELLEKILLSQSKGSHFLPCGYGFGVAIFAGTAAMLAGIAAIDLYSDYTRSDRQDIIKEKAAIESEITLLQNEGVYSDSYLIASRRAEIVQLDIEYSQMMDDKERRAKKGMIAGSIAGAMAVTAVVGLISDNHCGY